MKKPARGAGAAAFLLPFGLVVAGFALAGVYPFGPFYAFIVDMQQQYFPFLTWFQREMAGGLSSWTWSIGLGTSVVPLYAYYLASPLNFLLLLVPSAFLSEAVTVLIAVKIGLAGWFAWLALRKMTGLSGVEALIFSGLYALCGFAIGYQANIIWLDTFALLPLLCMATLRLLKDKRWGWYPLLLALCIWCNYYLGFMVCIFVVLVFVAAGIAQKISLREWGRRLARLLLASLTGVAMTAVILLPSILALAQNGSLSAETWESFILYNPIDVLGNFALLSKPTLLEGLPNVFVGVLGMMLAILYL